MLCPKCADEMYVGAIVHTDKGMFTRWVCTRSFHHLPDYGDREVLEVIA